MSIGNSPEDLSQAILVGAILVGRLGIAATRFALSALAGRGWPRLAVAGLGWLFFFFF